MLTIISTGKDDDSYAKGLVEYLNLDADRFIFAGTRQTTSDINRKAALLIEQGNIIATPGDPYTYKLA